MRRGSAGGASAAAFDRPDTTMLAWASPPSAAGAPASIAGTAILGPRLSMKGLDEGGLVGIGCGDHSTRGHLAPQHRLYVLGQLRVDRGRRPIEPDGRAAVLLELDVIGKDGSEQRVLLIGERG